ncbi:hypothetical protein BGX24_008119, partial [Mortierella sp. AD032]
MGLKPSIQAHFAGNPTLRQDLATVMQIAESLDSVQYQNQNRPPVQWSRPTFGNPVQPESFPQPMDLDSTVHSSLSRNPGQETQMQLDAKNHACFLCHVP